MRAAVLLVLALPLSGCAGNFHEKVADAVQARDFEPEATSVNCGETGEPDAAPGFTLWSCTLELETGGGARCGAISGRGGIHLTGCSGVRVAPPTREQVEGEMYAADEDATDVSCRQRTATRWRCTYRYEDRSRRGAGTYEASEDGSSEVGVYGSSSAEQP